MLSVEQFSRIIARKRAKVLPSYRHRYRVLPVEDIFQQTCLELWKAHISDRSKFQNEVHLSSTFELKFKNRIDDEIRAMNGRSPRGRYEFLQLTDAEQVQLTDDLIYATRLKTELLTELKNMDEETREAFGLIPSACLKATLNQRRARYMKDRHVRLSD